jgi:hypothetical protein
VRGLFQFVCDDHLVLLSISERVTVQSKLAEAQRSGAESASHPARVLTVGEGSALSDLDNVTVRIADVAAGLAVLGDRLRDELRSSTFP